MLLTATPPMAVRTVTGWASDLRVPFNAPMEALFLEGSVAVVEGYRATNAAPSRARIRCRDRNTQTMSFAVSRAVARRSRFTHVLGVRVVSTATGAKVSTVKVLREALVRGLAAREQAQAGVEALLQKYAAEFARFGIGATAQLTVVASGVTQKYAPPPGGADAWSRPARAPTSKRKAPAAPKAAVTTTTAKRPRSRSRRQQATVRREPSGDDDDGGDGEPAPAPREPSHACAKAGSGSAGPTPIAAARGPSELSTVDPAWRASARTALARVFLAALRRA